MSVAVLALLIFAQHQNGPQSSVARVETTTGHSIQVQLLVPSLASRHNYTRWCLIVNELAEKEAKGDEALAALMAIANKGNVEQAIEVVTHHKFKANSETCLGFHAFNFDVRRSVDRKKVRKLYQENPDSSTVRNSFALSEYYDGRLKEADSHLVELSKDAVSPVILINRAYLAYLDQKYEEAKLLYIEAAEMAPSWDLPLMLKFDCAVARDDGPAADSCCVAILERRPRDPTWTAIRSQVLMLAQDPQTRDLALAKSLAESALTSQASVPLAKDAMAMALSLEKKYDDALTIYLDGLKARGIKTTSLANDDLLDSLKRHEPLRLGLRQLRLR